MTSTCGQKRSSPESESDDVLVPEVRKQRRSHSAILAEMAVSKSDMEGDLDSSDNEEPTKKRAKSLKSRAIVQSQWSSEEVREFFAAVALCDCNHEPKSWSFLYHSVNRIIIHPAFILLACELHVNAKSSRHSPFVLSFSLSFVRLFTARRTNSSKLLSRSMVLRTGLSLLQNSPTRHSRTVSVVTNLH